MGVGVKDGVILGVTELVGVIDGVTAGSVGVILGVGVIVGVGVIDSVGVIDGVGVIVVVGVIPFYEDYVSVQPCRNSQRGTREAKIPKMINSISFLNNGVPM